MVIQGPLTNRPRPQQVTTFTRQPGRPVNGQGTSQVTQGLVQPTPSSLPGRAAHRGYLGPPCSPEAGGKVHRHVLVALLEAVVLSDVVQVVSADDNGPLHLHFGHHTCARRGRSRVRPHREGSHGQPRACWESGAAEQGSQEALLLASAVPTAFSAVPGVGI